MLRQAEATRGEKGRATLKSVIVSLVLRCGGRHAERDPALAGRGCKWLVGGSLPHHLLVPDRYVIRARGLLQDEAERDLGPVTEGDIDRGGSDVCPPGLASSPDRDGVHSALRGCLETSPA